MSHSKSLGEFKNAASKLHAPGLNIMYGDAKNNIASTKVMPQIVENDNNVLPAGNLSSTSDPNHQNNSKKCKVAIEYFEGKGLSQSEIQNALEKEKFTTEEIGYIMNRVNFTKV